MDLRDRFAAAALAGMPLGTLPVNDSSARNTMLREFAKSAYDLADALLKERETRPMVESPESELIRTLRASLQLCRRAANDKETP